MPRIPRKQDADALLAAHDVPQASAHDVESAISVTPMPHISAATLVTEGNKHGERSHVKAVNVSSEQAAVALLAAYSV